LTGSRGVIRSAVHLVFGPGCVFQGRCWVLVRPSSNWSRIHIAKNPRTTMAESKTEQKGSRIATFVEEVKDESKRVTWPSREKTKQSIFLVLAVSAILAVYIGIIDVMLSSVYSWIFA